ncbi:putative N-acetyltransferase 8B [Myripristis murdjan]|uniref:putative N-acetyltransferase 8B n=1 Tax=Myripristis murdjan TaxID=586833 RepID=UPI001175EEFB|nr:putative N-acetyltransferase 8B [Myripristis murdjan]
MKLVIRRYRPSDKDTVLTLFSNGVVEQISPCFYNAMTSPLYLSITLGLCAAGYLLGSILGAVVLVGGWVALIYFSCHKLYTHYIREKIRTDMQDIPGNFMTRPDDCFFVAEAEVSGRSQVIGTVAIVAKQSGTERYGELFRMSVSSSCRRAGLASRMTQAVIDFCRERGLPKVVLQTTSTQAAAVALYEKLGFLRIFSQPTLSFPYWMIILSRVKIVKMEKCI